MIKIIFINLKQSPLELRLYSIITVELLCHDIVLITTHCINHVCHKGKIITTSALCHSKTSRNITEKDKEICNDDSSCC